MESSKAALPAAAGSTESAALQLVHLQESLGIVTWVWDVTGGRVEWFGDLSPLIGLPAGGFGGQFADWLARAHPDDAVPSRERFIACLKGRLPEYRAEERVLWPDGQVRWLETCGRGVYGADGRAVRLVGVVRDITGRKQSEQAVQANEERLRRLIENAPVAIGMSHGDTVSYVNPSFVELFGASDESQLVGRPVTELVALHERESFAVRSARRAAGAKVETTYETTMVRRDGREFACQISVAGTVLAGSPEVLVFLQDISERQRAEQAIRALNAGLEQRVAERTQALAASNTALAEARDAAEAATRAKGAFLANMSHEIRTPMNAVLGLADLALRVPGLPERAEGYLRHLRGAGESLLGIINDVLDFSKIESGKLTIESERFALDEVLERVTSLVGLKASEKGLDFLIDTARDVPRHLVGDPLRLGQVLINLCSNAVKFTERGEIVVVTVRTEAHLAGRITLRFAVRDTGIGIAPEQIGRLFQPFDQLDPSTTRRHGGTGLGLAICKQIVGLMGGEIGVRSRLGHGSEFHFSLPFALPDGESTVEPAVEPPARRVLVVDDSENAIEILCDMLSAMGCRHAAARSAGEALACVAAAAAADPFDAALIDWRMPGVDGFELGARLRDAAPALRRVLVTAYGDDGMAARAREAGFAGYVAKPVSAAALRRALQAAPVAPRPAPAPAPAEASISGRRILLVEDNELNQMVASELLSGVGGAEVVVAGDGLQALAQLDGGVPFDLVLMDIQMPGIDGYEATRRIRGDARHAALPIVAMTAHAMAGDRDLALAAGMNDFVGKPFEPAELFAVVAKWLPARGPASGFDLELGLRRCLGRHDLHAKLLRRFVETRADDVALVRAAAAAGDVAALSAIAHGLVSSAGTIGAQPLSDLAREIQDTSTVGRPGIAPGLVERFAAEHARVYAAVVRHLDGAR